MSHESVTVYLLWGDNIWFLAHSQDYAQSPQILKAWLTLVIQCEIHKLWTAI